MKLSDYSHSLKHAYAKTFSHSTYNSSSGWNKVSLKDIGIRQPVVHFDLDNHYGDLSGGTTMSSLSSVRKLSEDLARKHISEIDEVDESPAFFGPGKWTWDRKMSSGSVLSDSSRKSSLDEQRKKKSSDGSLYQYLDYLGERRRSSDVSVVLTEDTDSFIIGERVWVGGTKPGQIAYIGETQFAPGEWAGVVLDDTIGKNDGSVANIRYFQCEPKKGVFSRLTRLTRYPILEAPSPEPKAPSPAPSMEHRRSNGSLTATPPKKSSLTLTSTPKTSISKPSSPDSALHPNIHVGDRVIVMSAQGSKAGVLRFMGPTDFAPGEWCGVELDDPLGKNDGSVAGTRYFECAPRFGLFAPIHKVTKSPVSRKPSQNCQIHRRGSKESLVSLTSSVASVRSTAPKKVAARVPTTPTSTKNALQEEFAYYWGIGYY